MESFYHEGFSFSRILFLHLFGRFILFESCNLLMWYRMFVDLHVLDLPPCIPRINPTRSCYMIFLVFCGIQFASILRILHLCSSGKLVKVFFFVMSVWFWSQRCSVSWNESYRAPSCSVFCNSLERIAGGLF
jgi:hypothetical protein